MVANIALIAWIFISLILFALLPPRRAFLLTYFIGILILPVEIGAGTGAQGVLALTNSLRIEKYTACHIGALLGTFLFAPHLVRRYRPDLFDATFLLLTLGVVATTLISGQHLSDGLSNAANAFRLWAPILFLAKIYITTLDDLYDTLRTMIAAAFLYSFISVAEFRLAPQTHTLIYGYFQHGFEQFARYSHFRPVGMLRHAIELSFFMGTSALAALWLISKKMFPPLWNFIPNWLLLTTLLIGLACTLTFDGYIAFLLGSSMLILLSAAHNTRTNTPRLLLLLLPSAALTWMLGRYLGLIDPAFLINWAAKIDPARADSLLYRLQAEDLHMHISHQHILFGLGTQGALLKTDAGTLVKAVDAFWLLQLTFYGLLGLATWLTLWSAGIFAAFRLWPRLAQPNPTHARWLIALVAVLLGLNLTDFLFNSFPSYFLMILSFGLLSVAHHYPQSSRPAAPPDTPSLLHPLGIIDPAPTILLDRT